MFEMIPKSLGISENIETRKLFTFYVGENEKQPSYGFVEPSVGPKFLADLLNFQKCVFLSI